MNEAFRQDLRQLINAHSIDNYCQTPDLILTEYVIRSIEAYREGMLNRDKFVVPQFKMKLEEWTNDMNS